MSNLSPRALALYQAHGPGPVDWERMVKVVDRAVEMARPGWMPIETAPRDGTFVLCSMASGHVTILQYCRDNYWRRDVFSELLRKPVYWMPLPAPPVDAKKSEEAGV